MSFYGEQPKLNELNFKFDAYYPNRQALVAALNTLNNNNEPPYVGSYVLVSYYINAATTNTDGLSATVQLGPGRYTSATPNTGVLTYNVEENEIYKNNLRIDLGQYKNNYHNTVWQRVGANNNSTFIMIAELNSLAPQFNIEYIHSARTATNITEADTNKSRYTYGINTSYPNYNVDSSLSPIQNLIKFLNQTDNTTNPYTILNNTNLIPNEIVLSYNVPQLDLENSSELGYQCEMPTIPYFLFNLQKNNTALSAPDSINVAYDTNADAYVLNMFLGHFDAYLKKAADGFEINENNFNAVWAASNDWEAAAWTVNS